MYQSIKETDDIRIKDNVLVRNNKNGMLNVNRKAESPGKMPAIEQQEQVKFGKQQGW